MADSNPNAVKYSSNPNWESRQDVVYHYLAYHFFDADETNGTTTIELVNLTDADKDYFNRVALITRGLSIEKKLVTYLNSPPNYVLNRHYSSQDLNSVSTNTYRRRFIHHVRAYNLSQPDARARFYIIGLTVDDIEYLAGLKPADACIDSVGQLNLASDGCLRYHKDLAANVAVIDRVEAKIAKFTEKIHQQKGQNENSFDSVNGTFTNDTTKHGDKTKETQMTFNDNDIEAVENVPDILKTLNMNVAEKTGAPRRDTPDTPMDPINGATARQEINSVASSNGP